MYDSKTKKKHRVISNCNYKIYERCTLSVKGAPSYYC